MGHLAFRFYRLNLSDRIGISSIKLTRRLCSSPRLSSPLPNQVANFAVSPQHYFTTILFFRISTSVCPKGSKGAKERRSGGTIVAFPVHYSYRVQITLARKMISAQCHLIGPACHANFASPRKLRFSRFTLH